MAGAGPVAGADLVANAIKSYDVFADVRAANTPNLASGQTLIIEVQGGISVNDGLGGNFYWSAGSLIADDGRTVLKPNTNTGNGRYLRYWGLGQPQPVLKTTDQVVANSTVLVNDSQLTANLNAGTYLLSIRAILLGTGGTGQGYKVQPTFGGILAAVSQGAGVNTANGAAGAIAPLMGAAVTAAAISSTTGDAFNADFILQVTAFGNFTLQFAQNASSANATIMKAGSSLLVTRIA